MPTVSASPSSANAIDPLTAQQRKEKKAREDKAKAKADAIKANKQKAIENFAAEETRLRSESAGQSGVLPALPVGEADPMLGNIDNPGSVAADRRFTAEQIRLAGEKQRAEHRNVAADNFAIEQNRLSGQREADRVAQEDRQRLLREKKAADDFAAEQLRMSGQREADRVAQEDRQRLLREKQAEDDFKEENRRLSMAASDSEARRFKSVDLGDEELNAQKEAIFANWNKTKGEEGFDEALDRNKDGVINALDLGVVNAEQQGPPEPPPNYVKLSSEESLEEKELPLGHLELDDAKAVSALLSATGMEYSRFFEISKGTTEATPEERSAFETAGVSLPERGASSMRRELSGADVDTGKTESGLNEEAVDNVLTELNMHPSRFIGLTAGTLKPTLEERAAFEAIGVTFPDFIELDINNETVNDVIAKLGIDNPRFFGLSDGTIEATPEERAAFEAAGVPLPNFDGAEEPDSSASIATGANAKINDVIAKLGLDNDRFFGLSDGTIEATPEERAAFEAAGVPLPGRSPTAITGDAAAASQIIAATGISMERFLGLKDGTIDATPEERAAFEAAGQSLPGRIPTSSTTADILSATGMDNDRFFALSDGSLEATPEERAAFEAAGTPLPDFVGPNPDAVEETEEEALSRRIVEFGEGKANLTAGEYARLTPDQKTEFNKVADKRMQDAIKGVKDGSMSAQGARSLLATHPDRETRMDLMGQLSKIEQEQDAKDRASGEGRYADPGFSEESKVKNNITIVTDAFEEGGYDAFFDAMDEVNGDNSATDENPTGINKEVAEEIGLKDEDVEELDKAFEEDGFDGFFTKMDEINFKKDIADKYANGEITLDEFFAAVDEFNLEHGYITTDDVDENDPAVQKTLTDLKNNLTTELDAIIGELGFDMTEQRRARRQNVDLDIDAALERLARFNLLEPGASGEFERGIIEFEKQRMRSYNEIEVELAQRGDELGLRTAELMTNSLVQLGGLDLEEEKFGQSVSEFNASLKQRIDEFSQTYGLNAAQSEAVIRQINQEIINTTRATSAEISQKWANITGTVGTESGPMGAATLGVDLTNLDTSGPPESLMATAEGRAMRESFVAMMNREPTDEELQSMLLGDDIEVKGKPTLESMKLAAQVSQTAMERVAKYDAIARENGLDKEKFSQAKAEADRIWNETTIDVAAQFDLDPDKFRMDKWQYDQAILNGASEDEALISSGVSEEAQGNFLRAADQFDRVYGNQQKEVSQRLGFNADQFATANRQADEHEAKVADIWGSLLNSERSTHTFDFNAPELLSLGPDIDTLITDLGFTRSEGIGDGLFDWLMPGGGGPVQDLTEAQIALGILPDEGARHDGASGFTVAQVTDALADMSPDRLDSLRSRISAVWAVVPEDEMGVFIHSYMDAKASGNSSFDDEFISRNWFDELDGAEQTALFAILNGAGNISVEPKSPGVLETLGILVTQGATAYAASKQ